MRKADTTTDKVDSVLANKCKPKSMVWYEFCGFDLWRVATACHYCCKSRIRKRIKGLPSLSAKGVWIPRLRLKNIFIHFKTRSNDQRTKFDPSPTEWKRKDGQRQKTLVQWKSTPWLSSLKTEENRNVLCWDNETGRLSQSRSKVSRK